MSAAWEFTDRSEHRDTAQAAACCELPGKEGARLKFAFWRHLDRFVHRVELCSPDTHISLFRSHEGDPVEAWPPSPPLQQLSRAELPGGNAALLLIGMAGNTHWSLSVAVDSQQQELVFDVACRAVLRPIRLGSCYRLLAPQAEVQGNTLRVRAAGETCVVRTEVLAGDSATRLSLAGDFVTLVPASITLPLPATYRWKYCVGWHKSGS